MSPRERAEIDLLISSGVENIEHPSWFHARQVDAWNSRALEVAAIAGNQGGKTALLPYLLKREIQRCAPLIAMLGKGNFIFAGPTLTLLEAQAIPTFRQVFVSESNLGRLVMGGKPKFYFSPEGARRLTGTDAPITVHFAYANDSSNLESLTAQAGCWDEAGQKENVQGSYDAFTRRLGIARATTFETVKDWIDEDAERQSQFSWWVTRYYDIEGPDATFGRRFWGTTPYEWNWFKTLVYDVAVGADPKEWCLLNFPTWMNPRHSEEECRKQLNHMPLWKWQMMYEGRYTRPAGLVFDCFDEKNVCDPFDIPKSWNRWFGIDFGPINTAAVFWAENPETGDIVQYGEYHPGVNREWHEHVHAIERGAAAHWLPNEDERAPTSITPKGAGGNRTGEQGWREAFRKHGIPIDEPNPKHTDPALQYQCLYDLIKRKKLRVFRSCAKTIGQYQAFSHKLDDDNNPLDEFEDEKSMHMLAGSRYIAVKLNPPKALGWATDPNQLRKLTAALTPPAAA